MPTAAAYEISKFYGLTVRNQNRGYQREHTAQNA
jgi:hypothetical protein